MAEEPLLGQQSLQFPLRMRRELGVLAHSETFRN
jgi:hypothetical protein